VKNDKTITFSLGKEKELGDREILISVYDSLLEKGYDPVNQIVGYLISGDPIYITTHKNARNLIYKIDRDDLLKILVRYYIFG